MFNLKLLSTSVFVILVSLIFVDTAYSATRSSSAAMVIKAKRCYDATPSSYRKSMLTSISRALTHWNDGDKFSKMNNSQMANWNFNTAQTYADQVLQIGRAYRVTACN